MPLKILTFLFFVAYLRASFRKNSSHLIYTHFVNMNLWLILFHGTMISSNIQRVKNDDPSSDFWYFHGESCTIQVSKGTLVSLHYCSHSVLHLHLRYGPILPESVTLTEVLREALSFMKLQVSQYNPGQLRAHQLFLLLPETQLCHYLCWMFSSVLNMMSARRNDFNNNSYFAC